MSKHFILVVLSFCLLQVDSSSCSGESPWSSAQEYVDVCHLQNEFLSANCCLPPWEELRIIFSENLPQWSEDTRQSNTIRMRLAIAIENIQLVGVCQNFREDCLLGSFSLQAFRLLAQKGTSLDEDSLHSLKILIQDVEDKYSLLEIIESGFPIFLFLKLLFDNTKTDILLEPKNAKVALTKDNAHLLQHIQIARRQYRHTTNPFRTYDKIKLIEDKLLQAEEIRLRQCEPNLPSTVISILQEVERIKCFMDVTILSKRSYILLDRLSIPCIVTIHQPTLDILPNSPIIPLKAFVLPVRLRNDISTTANVGNSPDMFRADRIRATQKLGCSNFFGRIVYNAYMESNEKQLRIADVGAHYGGCAIWPACGLPASVVDVYEPDAEYMYTVEKTVELNACTRRENTTVRLYQMDLTHAKNYFRLDSCDESYDVVLVHATPKWKIVLDGLQKHLVRGLVPYLVVGCAEQDCPSVQNFSVELYDYMQDVSPDFEYEIFTDFFEEVRTVGIKLLI